MKGLLKGLRVVGWFALVWLTAAPLPAATIYGLLPDDTNALAGWRNTKKFQSTQTGNNLFVNVEFAVYAPTMFGASFGAANDPSGGTEYVYAYQLFNNAAGARAILNFTVDLQPFAAAGDIGKVESVISGFAGKNSTATTPWLFVGGSPPSSAKWDWSGGASPSISTASNLTNTNFSDILIFTSPNPPQWLNATLQGSTSSITRKADGDPNSGDPLNNDVLPSPVPEPAAIVLAVLGLAGLLIFRVAAEKRSRVAAR